MLGMTGLLCQESTSICQYMGSWEINRFSGQGQCILAGIRLLLFNQCTRGCYCSTLESWDLGIGNLEADNHWCSKVQFWELENGSGPLIPLHLSSSNWAWKPGERVGNTCWALQEPNNWYQKPDSIRSMWGARKYWAYGKHWSVLNPQAG